MKNLSILLLILVIILPRTVLAAPLNPVLTPIFTPKPIIKPTPTPTIKPTPTPTIRPIMKPTITPYEIYTPQPIKIIKPSISPIAIIILSPTPSNKPVATPISLAISIQQIGDQFVDLMIQGISNNYMLYINGNYKYNVTNGKLRMDGFTPNTTIKIQIMDTLSSETKIINVRLKRQLYETRAFFHKLSSSDIQNLTFSFTTNVTSTYRDYTNFAMQQLLSLGIKSNELANSSKALVSVDQFEPDFVCAAYTIVDSYSSYFVPSKLSVVFNPAAMDTYQKTHDQKIATHEFGHVIGLEHQNDGDLSADDNIEPSVMRQGGVPWGNTFQQLDRYNVNYEYKNDFKTTLATISSNQLHADVPQLTFDELLASSDVVLIAKPKQTKSLPMQLVTETDLDVLQVIKGSAIAKVYEPYFYKGGIKTTIESYQPMSQNQQYLLFLKKHTQKNTYMINGIMQGQFSFAQLDANLIDLPYPAYPKLKMDAMNWLKGKLK